MRLDALIILAPVGRFWEPFGPPLGANGVPKSSILAPGSIKSLKNDVRIKWLLQHCDWGVRRACSIFCTVFTCLLLSITCPNLQIYVLKNVRDYSSACTSGYVWDYVLEYVSEYLMNTPSPFQAKILATTTEHLLPPVP